MNDNLNLLNKIAKIKQWGKIKFLLIYGLSIYGILLFFIYHSTLLLVSLYTVPDITFVKYITDESNIIRFISSFLLFELLGLYLANSQWRSYQKKKLL